MPVLVRDEQELPLDGQLLANHEGWVIVGRVVAEDLRPQRDDLRGILLGEGSDSQDRCSMAITWLSIEISTAYRRPRHVPRHGVGQGWDEKGPFAFPRHMVPRLPAARTRNEANARP